jgi:hypothetical protein
VTWYVIKQDNRSVRIHDLSILNCMYLNLDSTIHHREYNCDTFVCYRQVNMAVGFGAIRRSVSEDLIVSSYHLIRKYTVKHYFPL